MNMLIDKSFSDFSKTSKLVKQRTLTNRQAEIHSVAAEPPNCRTAQNTETKFKRADLQAQSITTVQMHLKYHMQPAYHRFM